MKPVDLRSDTVTRPTAAMREAMLRAPVGDDVFRDDPTVNALQERVAAESGHEAALFTPSGTMANQIAIAVHTRRGDEVLMADSAHPYHYEAGGAAVISGVQIRLLPTRSGLMDPADIGPAVRPPDVHHAPASLFCVEDTSNRGGGTLHPQALLHGLVDAARAHGLATHLDGARAYNAAVAAGEPLRDRVSGFDSVSLCFSKGLGAPVGSALCGSAAFIDRARRVRKMLGGGMRQAGMLAAAALHALDHHVERLAEDHTRARSLAMGLMIEGYTVQTPQTNLVFVDVPRAQEAQAFLAERGVLIAAISPVRARLALHLDVDDTGVERTLAGFRAWRTHTA